MSSEVKWIKIVTDIFDDEKILLIESMPESDGIIVIWFKILCLAGKINNCGVLTMNDRIPYTDEMLAHVFRRPLNTVRLALKTFEQFGMIEIVNDTIVIPNWEKHQNIEGMERVKEQTRKRVSEYRERQRIGAALAKANVNVTLPVTLRNAPEEEREEERDKDKEKKDVCAEVNSAPTEPPVISMPCIKGEVYEISNEDFEKDKETYPAVDVMQEYRKMKRWLETHKSNMKTKRGMPKFINSWLAGEQDKGGKKGNGGINAQNDSAQSGRTYSEKNGGNSGPRTVYTLKPRFAGHKYDADGNDITES